MQIDKNGEVYLQSLLNKDETGVLMIYQDLFPKVKKYVTSNKGNIDDARDVMQKALMQITIRARVKGFNISTSFEGYLFITSRNIWLRELKKKSLQVTNYNFSDHHNVIQEITDSAIEQEKWDLFQEKMKKIPDRCRQLLGLFFKKVSYKKIALELKYASENVVKQRIFKCKAKLKDEIKGDERYNELIG